MTTTATETTKSATPCTCGHVGHNEDGCMHPHDDGSFRFCDCKATSSAPPKFTAQEIAYQLPDRRRGYAMGAWKRCIVSTQKMLDRKLAKLAEDGARVEIRDAY